MTTAKLAITLPDRVWAASITREYPETTITALAHVPRGDSGFGLALISSDDLDAVIDAVEAHPSITEVEVVSRTDPEATIEFTTDHPLILFSSQAAGTAIEMPVKIEDGVATVEVTGSRERLSRLGDHFSALDLEFEVVYIQEYTEPGGILSSRQRELICAAVDRGYYDSPRRCTLTELAEEFDIAKSTCSEILHRAEGEIITRFVDTLPAIEPAPRAE